MFEAYTETARRAVLLGRHEASETGSESLEVEHILLGILRVDLPLAICVFRSREAVNGIRSRITRGLPANEPRPARAEDIPCSRNCKRMIAQAAAEAQRLNQTFIATEHFLMAMLKENTGTATDVLRESGVTVADLEYELKQKTPNPAKPEIPDGFRDLVDEAYGGAAAPLIGREQELEQIIQILSRRTRNSVVLLGEPGVGKDSIVRGLAQRIAVNHVPFDLEERQILQIEASDLAQMFALIRAGHPAKTPINQALLDISRFGGAFVYVRGLFDMREGASALASYLKTSKLQIIATSSVLSLRLARDRDDELAGHFEAVNVLPPSEEQAIQIIESTKQKFEAFHDVVVSAEAIRTAITASGRFLKTRALPDRALDLIDEAGAHVKLRRDVKPPELVGLQRRLRSVARDLEYAIANHEFGRARKLSTEDSELRERISKFRPVQHTNTVGVADIFEVVAARTSLSVTAVKDALERPAESDPRDQVRSQIISKIPVGRRDWVDGLLSYLSDCSAEDADHLLEAIRATQPWRRSGR